MICRRVDPRICKKVFLRVRQALREFEPVKNAIREFEEKLGRSERQIWRYLGFWRLKSLERECALRPARPQFPR